MSTPPSLASPVADPVGSSAAATPLALSLRLFGGFAATVHGTPLRALRTRHGGRLLALLALTNGQEQPRTALAGRLWPDSRSDDAAAASLRRALTDLRDALGPEASRLESPTYFTLRLDLSGDATCDVLAFDRAIAEGTPAAWDRAIDLYRGPLMPDLDAVHDPDGHLRVERERRHLRFLDAIERRAGLHQANREWEESIADFRRLLAVDPMRESASRSLMTLLTSEMGDRTGAMAEYQRLRRALASGLGAEPEDETVALHEQIQAGKAGAHPASAAALYNLPSHLTRFVGREKEREETRRLLRDNRLLTLTGTGGTGKTRLSQQIAGEVRGDYPDGVCLVELSPVSDPSRVIAAVSLALGIREHSGQRGRSDEGTLIDTLTNKRLLLLLDNCEHLRLACASLTAAVLRACPGVTILATSREAMGILGEQTYRVPSMALPGADRKMAPETAASAADYEAVQLFLDRARLVRRDFALTDTNATATVRVCQRLDGIPLALELAAARTRTMPVDQIDASLDDRFRFLAGGDRTAIPRHQTLRSLFDWSFDLLNSEEKTLLVRLSVFAGGWTLAAAQSICGDDATDTVAMQDLLTSLTDKSLLYYNDNDGTLRYGMLETMRQYSAEELAVRGETEVIQRQHLDWYRAFAEEAEPQLKGSEQTLWMLRLESEHDNFRAALKECLTGVSEHTAFNGLRLAGALGRFWNIRGYFSEGREALTRARRTWTDATAHATGGYTPLLPPTDVSAALAKALYWTGQMALRQGDFEAARTFTVEGLALQKEQGDTSGVANSLNNLGALAQQQGDIVAARAFYTECLTLRREIQDKRGIALALGNLAGLSVNEGDLSTAKRLFESQLCLCRQLDDLNAIASSLNALGIIAYNEADWGKARSLYEESLCLQGATGDKSDMAFALANLGLTMGEQGDAVKAQALCEESLALRRSMGDKGGIALALEYLGGLSQNRGDIGKARVFTEESLALYRELGNKLRIGNSLLQLGDISRMQGDRIAAESLLKEGLQILCGIGSKLHTVVALESLAALYLDDGQSRCAVTLWGAATVLRETLGVRLSPNAQAILDRNLTQTSATLGVTAYTAAYKEGKAMSWEQAVAYALSETNLAPDEKY